MGYGRNIGWVLLVLSFAACKEKTATTKKTGGTDTAAIRELYAESPVEDAGSAISKMIVEPGLKVELVASEPLVIAPVAMTFDSKGRMWVVEMTGYMPDTAGTGEDALDGKIVILEDTNHDGRMDTRKVFMDSLVLPRGICLIEDGILIAEPPKLWYVRIKDDKPVKKTLVDDKYAEGGNVEHQPNGLLRAMDNWIYNAKSDKRYRKQGDKWLIERTHFRGQWGITQDDYGRLFYNNNSENILGDYFSPGLGSGNSHQQRVSGFNEKIIKDNRVFPIRATTGVNRGYMKGTLDDSLKLVNFTAACGPLIYRADLLGASFKGNGFVAEPSANLIKRNIISDSGISVRGRQAYEDKEFLASMDERFRPVNLYTGLEGAMYVLDMYRGIIQHKTYLTPYLKNEIKSRKLTLPLNCGRIYRIVPANAKPTQVIPGNDPAKLVALLRDSNGSVRDLAQQLLVDSKAKTVVPQLRSMLADTTRPVTIMHALWTLEGFGALDVKDVEPLLRNGNPALQAQAMAVIPSIVNSGNQKQIFALLKNFVADSASAIRLAFVLGKIQKYDNAGVRSFHDQLLKMYPQNVYIADAILSTMENREEELNNQLVKNNDTALAIYTRLVRVRRDVVNKANAKRNEALAKVYPAGAKIVTSVCQTCHGKDAEGVQSLAPPLNRSNWVTGNPDHLTRIVLFGLTGPVDVNGKLYKAPEINGDMPGIGSSTEFKDEDIAQLLSFIRNGWSNKAAPISAKEVSKIRKQYSGRQKPFTMDELKGIK
jgi:mono/diheme cytochrome c family protein/glucose/arabinose dehydrogenase